MNPDQDPVIARALADLPVPDHGPGFWEGLERRLAGDVPAAADTVDLRDDAGGDEPPEPRTSTGELPSVADLYLRDETPRRPRIWFAAAAAIVILAVISAAFVLAGGDDDEPEVATPAEDTTETTVALSTTSGGDSTTTEATTSGSSPPESEGPGPVVTEWLGAVASGDVETAVALTGPRSIAHVESLGGDASVEGLIRESAEGYGGMSAARDLEVQVLTLGSFDFGDVSLVLLTGTNAGEGGDGTPQTVAIPVVTADGASLVEPWAFGAGGDRLEVTQPDEGTLDPEQAIELFAPVDGTVFFRLDDGIEGIRPVETSTVAGAPFARYDPPGALERGEHIVIVGFVDPEGDVLLGEAIEFTAG